MSRYDFGLEVRTFYEIDCQGCGWGRAVTDVGAVFDAVTRHHADDCPYPRRVTVARRREVPPGEPWHWEIVISDPIEGRRHTVLKTISYKDEAAKDMVTKFCGHVHRLIRLRHVFKVLFEDERPSCQTLMKKTAWSFFLDLNTVLHEYLLLECAKITDPARIDNHANFTVDALVQNICWPNDKASLKKMTSLPSDDKDIMKALKFWQDITQDFRRCIKRARNKLLAHSDRTAVLSGEPLGAFPEGKDKDFFGALEKICNITHEACSGEIYGYMSTITWGGGDVISLRKTLECAVAFKKALSEGSGQNKTWLYSCLEKARHEPKS